MPRRGSKKLRVPVGDPTDPEGFWAWRQRFLEAMRVRRYSERTVGAHEEYLGWFFRWCRERGVLRPREVTRPLVQRYQSHLFYYRKASGEPLSPAGQRNYMVPVLAFFKWLTRQNALLSNPAADIDLPRREERLPRHVLTVAEAEAVLAQAQPDHPLGVRDRAILETFYSTGMRRMEVAGLAVFDLDAERGTVRVRQGKGRKDRLIPIGERAVAWIRRYREEIRPILAREPDDGTLFLTHTGEAFTLQRLSQLVADYVDRAALGKRGACHLFRHALATTMLENGADIRFIQAMLGHASLSTTQIYTHLSIRKLKEIHTATHPSGKLAGADQDEPEETGQAPDEGREDGRGAGS